MSRGPRIVPLNEAELANLDKGRQVVAEGFRVKVATLEELMEMGADAREIPQRAGWAHRQSMRKQLQRKELHELWREFQEYDARFDRN